MLGKINIAFIFALLLSGCPDADKKTGGDEIVPIVTPTPTPSPSPTNTATGGKDGGGETKGGAVVENKAPVFDKLSSLVYAVDEGASMAFSLKAKDPEGGKVSFFLSCVGLCKDAMKVSADGAFSWTPGFFDAGAYTLSVIAKDDFGNEATAGPFSITVNNVNRAPVVQKVEVRDVIGTSGGVAFLSCDVTVTEPDREDYILSRAWFIDGVETEMSRGQTLAGQRYAPISAFLAGQKVKCKASAKDVKNLSSDFYTSLEATVKNTPPSFSANSISISNISRAGQTPRVGDSILCLFAASDVDPLDVPSRERTIYYADGVQVYESFSTNTAAGASGGAAFSLSKAVAHKSLTCRVSITDGVNKVLSLSSPPVTVANTSPTVSATLSETNGNVLKTGGRLSCVVTAVDPDGDILSVSNSFLNLKNGGSEVDRGGGEISSYESSSRTLVYALKTIAQVSQGADADVRGDVFRCSGTVSDGYGAAISYGSSSMTVSDSLPWIRKEYASSYPGQLSQTIYTGEKIQPILFLAGDDDGDTVTFVAGPPSSGASCDSKGITFNPAFSSSGIFSMPSSLGAPTGAHAARDCGHRIYASASNGAISSGIDFSIVAPNRAPVLSCGDSTKTTQYLAPARVGFSGTIGSDGESATTINCLVSDPDDPTPTGSGSHFGFGASIQIVSNTCPTVSSVTSTPINAEQANISSKMGVTECQFVLRGSDGGLQTNSITVHLKPLLGFVMGSQAPRLSSSCEISLAANTGYPFFATEAGASWMDSSVSLSGVNRLSLPSAIEADYFLSKNQYRALLSDSDIASVAAGVVPRQTIDWQTRASVGGFSKTANYQKSIIYSKLTNVESGTSSLTGFPTRLMRPWASGLTIGQDAGKGREGASGQGCTPMGECPDSATSARASVVAGQDFTCYLAENGTPYCFGSNSASQSGLTADAGSATPRPIAPSAKNPVTDAEETTPSELYVKTLSAGLQHVCALTAQGKVYCWGKNDYGQIGNGQGGPLVPSSLPSFVKFKDPADSTVKLLDGVVAIASGLNHNCALRVESGKARLYCWGKNDYGQAGLGSAPATAVEAPAIHDDCGDGGAFVPCLLMPTPAVSPNSGFTAVFAGGNTTCVTDVERKVACFGDGSMGQLGLGGPGYKAFGYYRTDSGDSSCSESNGRAGLSGCAPGHVKNLAAGVVSAEISESNACFGSEDGGAFCVGQNDYGQLGLGAGGSSLVTEPYCKGGSGSCLLSPHVFDGGTAVGNSVGSMAVANGVICFVTSDRLIKCAGTNQNGLLGRNVSPATLASASSIGTVLKSDGTALANVRSLVAGVDHFCAIAGTGSGIVEDTVSAMGSDGDAELYCWGAGDSNKNGNASSQALTSASKVSTTGIKPVVKKCLLRYSVSFEYP